METIAVIHLGHSHLAAMVPYLWGRELENTNSNRVEHYVFDTSAHNIFAVDESRFAYGVNCGEGITLNPEIISMVERRIAPDRRVVYVSLFGGNSHNVLTLLQPARKFDFVVPWMPELPLREDYELIPHAAIREALLANTSIFLDDLRGLRNSVDQQVMHVISPPPIGNDEYLKTVVANDPYFSALGSENVTPAVIRYKSWAMHTKLYSDLCEEIGVDVIMPPPEATIDGKWLAPDCYGADPTHGNVHYGGLILRAIEQKLEGHFAGWDWLR
ncbi:hypothetical protein BTE77_26345 [Ensifer adhaerens]|nr:hypothetical protein BTE77_26345 [Ensifer adhaerens]